MCNRTVAGAVTKQYHQQNPPVIIVYIVCFNQYLLLVFLETFDSLE